MKKLKLIFTSGLVLLLTLIALVLIPRSYDVEPFAKRACTQFWTLKDNTKIGYTRISGNQSKKKSPIIYLHGGPGGMITDRIIDSYKPLSHLGHDIYFYDQIGSGHSDRLEEIENYTVERHRRDLEEIIGKIVADQVILIGQSWGACLAINYLQHNPASVEKIVLTSPGPILPRNRDLRDRVAPDSLDFIKPKFSNKDGNLKAANWKTNLVEKVAHAFRSKLASDEEMDNYFTHLSKELIKSTDCEPRTNPKVPGGGGYYSHIMTVRDIDRVEDGRETLRTSQVPLLIIKGQCDNQKWGYTEEYLDLFENAELKVMKGLGHDVLNSENAEAIGLISEFLEGRYWKNDASL